MGRKEIEKAVETLLEPCLEKEGIELVDVEYVKEGANWYLRVFADKEGGINIDDCVFISRALEEKLDEEDFIKDAYILEVSSPGLGRPLKKDKDFRRNLGKDVEGKFYKAQNGRREFEGTLKAFDEENVTIEIDHSDTVISRKDIAMIRLAIDF